LSETLTTDTPEVWLFDVDVYEDGHKHTFEARSDMTWMDFKDQVIAQLDAIEVCLKYCLDGCAWLDLSCKADLK
jgi:hypothetical protein